MIEELESEGLRGTRGSGNTIVVDRVQWILCWKKRKIKVLAVLDSCIGLRVIHRLYQD
jgi:hypothetical protein